MDYQGAREDKSMVDFVKAQVITVLCNKLEILIQNNGFLSVHSTLSDEHCN